MSRVPGTILGLVLLAGWPSCFAQGVTAGADLPPSNSGAKSKSGQDASLVPAAGDPFFAPVAISTQPQTFKERFMDYAVITYGPRSLVVPAFRAGFSMVNPPDGYPNEWRQGMGAFGRNYGHAFASRTSQQSARFLTAAVLREDFRYRPSKRKNPLARSFHALAFTFVDKSDSGRNRIAIANFAGAAAGGFVPNLYMPDRYDTVSRAQTRMAIAFGGFAAGNLMREFAPEILKIARKLHIPIRGKGMAAWWTPLK